MSSTLFACPKEVDPKKIMLFIDVNLSIKEVEAAKKSACERGETFTLWPDDKEIDQIRRDKYKYLTLDEYYGAKCKSSTPACDKLEKDLDSLKKNIDDYDYEPYELNPEKLKSILTPIKDKESVISTLIISGHDGGGEIDGDEIDGAVLKTELFEVYDSIFSREDKRSLNTILLWGCYTGTYSEASDWKSQFPAATAVVGYYDSAPLATRPASADLMEDFLLKEKDLYTSSNRDDLKKSIQNLKSILYTQPGLLINACGENIYYGHILKNGERKTFYMDSHETNKICELAKAEWKNDLKFSLSDYYEGSLDIPRIISGTKLRTMYGLVRQNEKCMKDIVDANKLGLLLFWNGVRENFSHKYNDLMVAAQKDLDGLAKEYNDVLIELEKVNSELKAAREKYNLYSDEVFGFYGDENLERLHKYIDGHKDKDEIFKKIYEFKLKNPEDDLPEDIKEMISKKPSYDHYDYKYFRDSMKDIKRQETLKVPYNEMKALREKKLQLQAVQKSGVNMPDLKEFRFPTKEITDYSRVNMIKNLRSMNNIFPGKWFQDQKDKYPNIEKAYKKIDHLLYQVDPSCMNFLDWHQYNPVKALPKNLCEDK